MKTIGILGGLGPQATTDFIDRIHRVSQQHIPQFAGTGYPPMIVYYCRFPPFLYDRHELVLPIQPEPQLFQAARQLGALVDFIVIPSNSTHLFEKEIAEAAGRTLLSIITVTINEITRKGWRRVGVIGFGNPTVYTRRLAELDIEYATVDDVVKEALNDAILAVMEGRVEQRHKNIAKVAVAALRAANIDGIILGCTEIPLLLDEMIDDADFLNPSQLLAEAAVACSLH